MDQGRLSQHRPLLFGSIGFLLTSALFRRLVPASLVGDIRMVDGQKHFSSFPSYDITSGHIRRSWRIKDGDLK